MCVLNNNNFSEKFNPEIYLSTKKVVKSIALDDLGFVKVFCLTNLSLVSKGKEISLSLRDCGLNFAKDSLKTISDVGKCLNEEISAFVP